MPAMERQKLWFSRGEEPSPGSQPRPPAQTPGPGGPAASPALPALGDEELQECPCTAWGGRGRVREQSGSTAGEAAPFNVLYCHHLRTSLSAAPGCPHRPARPAPRGPGLRHRGGKGRRNHSPGKALGGAEPEPRVHTRSLAAIPPHTGHSRGTDVRVPAADRVAAEVIPGKSQLNGQGLAPGSRHRAGAPLGARARAVPAAAQLGAVGQNSASPESRSHRRAHSWV